MKQQNQKISELEKLKALASYPVHPQFVTGYLAFGVPLQFSEEVQTLTEQFMSMAQDQLITSFNVLELLVIMKSEVLRGFQADQEKQLSTILVPYITELALDNSYLHRKYFQQPIPDSKIVPDNLGIECPICLTEINSSELCALSCGHMLHMECFNHYAREKINSKDIPFGCPQEGCLIEVSNEEAHQFLTRELKQKYDDFGFHNYVENHMGDTSWCPTPGCSAVFAFDEALTEYKCPACKKHYCLTCKCEFHTNITCKEYKSIANLSDDDKKFMFCVKGLKFKQCPSCKFWVERSEGCDHMTCRCKYQFCYVCGGQYGRCKCRGYDLEEEAPMPLPIPMPQPRVRVEMQELKSFSDNLAQSQQWKNISRKIPNPFEHKINPFRREPEKIRAALNVPEYQKPSPVKLEQSKKYPTTFMQLQKIRKRNKQKEGEVQRKRNYEAIQLLKEEKKISPKVIPIQKDDQKEKQPKLADIKSEVEKLRDQKTRYEQYKQERKIKDQEDREAFKIRAQRLEEAKEQQRRFKLQQQRERIVEEFNQRENKPQDSSLLISAKAEKPKVVYKSVNYALPHQHEGSPQSPRIKYSNNYLPQEKNGINFNISNPPSSNIANNSLAYPLQSIKNSPLKSAVAFDLEKERDEKESQKMREQIRLGIREQ